MNLIQSLRVDNESKPLSIFAVPGMSLSSSRASMTRHAFTMTANAKDVFEFMEPIYVAWVTESKEDDDQCGAPQDELAEAGYPEIRRLLESPLLLTLVMGNYLLEDLLGGSVWSGSGPIEYWLDTVSECRLDGDLLLLSGICYSRMGG